MQDFGGKIAVITGAGTGMGRELARQLTAEGCSVGLCDVNEETLAETKAMCEAEAPQGTKTMVHRVDVAIEDEYTAFREALKKELDTDHIHLLFNNAGIGGGGSFVAGARGDWEKTFNVCWGGVYYGCRVFLPMLVAAPEAHIVNTSSVNGFWASIGRDRPHTSYSAAKFAVKGFSEALMTDLRLNAPHVKCSVVMPGHIGTDIFANSQSYLQGGDGPTPEEQQQTRKLLEGRGLDVKNMSDEDIANVLAALSQEFRDNGVTTAEDASRIILDGVKAGNWRILVGEDAEWIDEQVRSTPGDAYGQEFFDRFAAKAGELRGENTLWS